MWRQTAGQIEKCRESSGRKGKKRELIAAVQYEIIEATFLFLALNFAFCFTYTQLIDIIWKLKLRINQCY